MKVELLGHFGDDLFAVNAARVSYNKWKDQWSDRDTSLLAYLGREGHWSPMAHCFVSFRISTNFAVARQLWKTHIGLVPTPGWNEVSRRYVVEEPQFDFPEGWRRVPGRGQSKQGSAGPLDSAGQQAARIISEEAARVAKISYNELLTLGVAPEQARLVLPMSTMTTWIWSGSLYAFIRVCLERLTDNAQSETRVVAQLIQAHLWGLFPHCMKAWGLGIGEVRFTNM